MDLAALPSQINSSPIKRSRKLLGETPKLPMMTRHVSTDKVFSRQNSADRVITRQASADRVITRQVSADRVITRQASADKVITKQHSCDHIMTKQSTTKPNRVHSFTEGQLAKYREWFDKIDTNGSGAVDVKELSRLLIEAHVVKNKREARVIFDEIDVNKNGTISFQEFVNAIADSEVKQRIQIRKLDTYIDAENLLDSETLLSAQRRQVIMDHIIRKNELRASDIDWMQTMGRLDGSEEVRESRRQITLAHVRDRAITDRFLREMKLKINMLKAKKAADEMEAIDAIRKETQRRTTYRMYCPELFPPSMESKHTQPQQHDDTHLPPAQRPSQMILFRSLTGEDSASCSGSVSRCCSDDDSLGSCAENDHSSVSFHYLDHGELFPVSEGGGVISSQGDIRIIEDLSPHYKSPPMRRTVGGMESVPQAVEDGKPARLVRSLSESSSKKRIVLKRIGCYEYEQPHDSEDAFDPHGDDSGDVEHTAASVQSKGTRPCALVTPNSECSRSQEGSPSNSKLYLHSIAKNRKDLQDMDRVTSFYSPIQSARSSSVGSSPIGSVVVQDSSMTSSPDWGCPKVQSPGSFIRTGRDSVAGRPLTTVRKKRFGAAVTGKPLL